MNELSQLRRPDPADFLFPCSVQPLRLLWPSWCFSFSPSTGDGRGNFKELLTCVISWGSLQGFHSRDTFLFFLFPSFFFYFTAWVEPYIFWAWPFSIWDTSCQLLIFIVVCWLCCIVSECSSIMEWIISLFDSLNLIFILFYFECHMVGFFLSVTINISIWGNHIHPSVYTFNFLQQHLWFLWLHFLLAFDSSQLFHCNCYGRDQAWWIIHMVWNKIDLDSDSVYDSNWFENLGKYLIFPKLAWVFSSVKWDC